MLTETDLNFTISQLQDLLTQANKSYFQLVLLCGSDWETRTQVLKATSEHLGWPYISVGLHLAENLLSKDDRQRPLQLERELEELLPKEPNLVLDHMEILFDADLRANPLQIMQRFSRQSSILASWPGKLQDSNLVYAQPQHAEFRTYPVGNLLYYTLT